MKAEIIAVGTELLLGHTVNTDAAHVARELAVLGITVHHTCVVGDNAARLEAALRESLSRADLVVTTGGLGPTDDDLTKEAVARVAEAPLEMDAASMARLEEYFGSRPMGENQRRQAFLPRGCAVFANRVGTAPGCAVATPSGGIVIMLPGPPSELLPMLREQAVPYLLRRSGAALRSHMIRTFALGEGDAALRIADLTSAANPTAATYATDTEMFVRVTALAADEAAAEALAAPVVEEVRRRLGDHVYGVDVPDLQTAAVEALRRRGQTLATAESCTGGLLSSLITDVPGASAVFLSGVTTYANAAKTALLGVPEDLLVRVGAVSPETARLMAENVRSRHGADWGIGITGIAGPGGGTPQKPVGLVFVALAGPDGTWLREMRPMGAPMARAWIRMRAAGHALDMLRRALSGLPPEMDGCH